MANLRLHHPEEGFEMASNTKVRPTSKSTLIKAIAEKTELSKKQVTEVLETLGELIRGDLRKKDVGVFTLPGLAKFKLVTKKAVPAGERMNPFTKQMQFFAAKPAKKVVKAVPVKALKDYAATVK
jgi:DNA-binding protein HU-beta